MAKYQIDGLTPQQQDAVNARGRNILVSAAAGSGKTTVLTDRVISLLTDEENPVDIDQLLIVTFTKKAAAEMKSRIEEGLQTAALEDENNEKLNRQLMLLPSAQICTIDSFCINLVKENFLKIRIIGSGDFKDECLPLSNDFSVMDTKEERALKNATLNKIIKDYFDSGDQDFKALYDFIGTQKGISLAELIDKVYDYIYVQADPFEWLDENIEKNYNSDVPFCDSIWYKELIDECTRLIFYAKDAIDDMCSLIDCCNHDELHEEYDKAPIARDTLNLLLNSLNGSPSEQIINIIDSLPKFNGNNMKKAVKSCPDMDKMKKDRNLYNSAVNDLNNLTIPTNGEYIMQTKAIYEILKILSGVEKKYDWELLKQKNEQNRYTYDDIQHFALDLLIKKDNNGNLKRDSEGNLIPSDIASTLQDTYKEILVDEYQDTNDVQDTLFSVLSNKKNLFMVGDVKQSIYRFRQATPQLFIEKKEKYQPYKNDGSDEPAQIILDTNFRSRKDICDYVNFMFSNFMSKRVGEIDYNEEEYLNPGITDYEETDTKSIQINIVKKAGKKKNEQLENEAKCVAKMIKEKIKNKEMIKDKESKHEIRYSDIALLFRTAKGKMDVYAAIFEQQGIPCVCNMKKSLLDYGEIKLIISFLRVINNRSSDIDLLNVMLSPLYSFTPGEITSIKLENKNSSFHRAVLKSEETKDFLEEIENFRRLSQTMSMADFIRFLCETKNIYAFAGTLSNGEQRYDNIREFIKFVAESFDTSNDVGLTAFLRFIDNVDKSDTDFQGTGSENAVTMTTVHGSKGLEYPVVIYVDTNNSPKNNGNSVLCMDRDLGIGIKYYDTDKNGKHKNKTIQYDIINRRCKEKEKSEALRVLYVAITRAKEQFISFITFSTTKNKDSFKKRIDELDTHILDGKVIPYYCENIGSDANYILTGAMLHKNGSMIYQNSSPKKQPKKVQDNWQFPIQIQFPQIQDENENKEENITVADPDEVERISQKLKSGYSDKTSVAVPAVCNASGLENSKEDTYYDFNVSPAFIKTGDSNHLSAEEKGTAMHEFMHFCDYVNAKSDLELEIKRLQDCGCLSEAQADSLDRSHLKTFFDSELAWRMFSVTPDKLYREMRLTSTMRACDVYPDKTKSIEEIIVQGIADCVFEEDGKLILVDYKTDTFDHKTDNPSGREKAKEDLKNHYRDQVNFYRQALKKALGKEVSKAYLYSFVLGEEISVEE